MYILSIDLGTSGLKVALVGENGDLAATATRSVHTRMLPPDGAEQDADAIWAAVLDAARQVLRAAGGAATRSPASPATASTSPSFPSIATFGRR